MKSENININEIEANTGQVPGLPANPRRWTRQDFEKLKKSIKETPELLEARGVIIYRHEGKYIVLGGNMRLEACRALKYKAVPCFVMPEDTPVEKLKEIVIKDNGAFGSWDMDALANEWDALPLNDWGVPLWDVSSSGEAGGTGGEDDAEEIERKRQEFKERMAAGEDLEEDEEYRAFVEKFEPKKTTDDCYTPEIVYDAVADWVASEYKVNRKDFVRPFYPGGDYEAYKYPDGCIVVDNPPFSILSKIIKFYTSKGIKFFLFAPSLTLFSSSSSSCCCLAVGVQVTYDNGAKVNTSFATNLEDLRFRSAPTLYKAVTEADDENLKNKKSLPAYNYPDNLVISYNIYRLSRADIDFAVPICESERISHLDSQKEKQTGIYGNGYLISDRLAAERLAAERLAAERLAADRLAAERLATKERISWPLSEREMGIIARLNNKEGKK